MKKILLDTHIIIWLVNEPERLNSKTLELLANKKLDVYYSLVSIWELVIKVSIKKINIDIRQLIETLQENSIFELSFDAKHVLQVQDLPIIHKDPFDRILIAQAISEGMHFFTHDEILRSYSKKLINIV